MIRLGASEGRTGGGKRYTHTLSGSPVDPDLMSPQVSDPMPATAALRMTTLNITGNGTSSFIKIEMSVLVIFYNVAFLSSYGKFDTRRVKGIAPHDKFSMNF